MAVVIQEIVGRRHGDRFYPDLSGVARSWNVYAAGASRPEDGVVSLALGLGKTIVDGGLAYTQAQLDASFGFLESDDYREGVAAFLAKRPPNFSGN